LGVISLGVSLEHCVVRVELNPQEAYLGGLCYVVTWGADPVSCESTGCIRVVRVSMVGPPGVNGLLVDWLCLSVTTLMDHRKVYPSSRVRGSLFGYVAASHNLLCRFMWHNLGELCGLCGYVEIGDSGGLLGTL
jgi:hypothetical protein